VLRYRRQAPCGNIQESLLSVGFGQPPALDQVEVEAPVSVQQVLFALGQGGHVIPLPESSDLSLMTDRAGKGWFSMLCHRSELIGSGIIGFAGLPWTGA
jgi:hypothetical protein